MNRELYIVDDNCDHHFLLYTILKQISADYSVRFFEDGKKLIRHLLSLSRNSDFPSLIVLDLNMPGMNGLQLLKLLKKPAESLLAPFALIPVIMLSSETRTDKIQQCYEAGASAFVVKPMDFEKLKNTLQVICEFWLDINDVSAIKKVSFKTQ